SGSPASNAERDGRRAEGVVEDLLIGRDQLDRTQWGFAGPGVAGVAGMSAAGDLNADPVAGEEAVGDGPKLEPDPRDPVGVALRRAGRQPQQRVADVPRRPFGVDVADPHEEIGVGAGGAHPDALSYRTDRVEGLRQRLGREGEDIRACLELAVVANGAAL